MKTLTIYTPAYNRGRLLGRVYESLKAQTVHDFVWMIVDDGSEDETESIVRSFASENIIETEYIKKENGGKHTATNAALKAVKTPLIMIALDSDDALKADAVEKILCAYRSAPEMQGYVFMKEDGGGKALYRYFSPSLSVMSWREAVGGGYFDGEALLVLKSDFAAMYPYPVIDGEGFFTEAYSYLQMREPFLWSREAIYTAEYLDDGYTKNIIKSFKENPVCYEMYNNLRMSVYSSFAKKLKYASYYDAFSMLSHKKGFVGSAARPLYSMLGLVPGLLFYIYLKLKKI